MTHHEDPLAEPAVPGLRLTPVVMLAIAIGGAVGTVARFLLDTTYSEPSGHFPITTLAINLSGSLAIGFLIPMADRVSARNLLLRPFLIVGILGGWTTYSTLAVDAVTLAKDGHAATAVLSIAATLVGGLALVAIGNAAGRRVGT
jgi:CrcB protein